MMSKQFDPFLKVSRVVVSKGGGVAYDQKFHEGLNVIRGKNSVGKSSIMELIFHGLGGELSRWRTEQGSCDYVTIEVFVNGAALTLKREIDPERIKIPIAIFWGSFDEASKSSSDGWQLYSQTRSETKESFSQVFFRALGLPETKGDSNITMHQILRILYVDQMTPPDSIFRQEQFDSPITRKAIGDMICGIFEEEILQLQLELREKEKTFDKLQDQIKNIYSVLGQSEQDFRVDRIQVELQDTQNEQTELYAKLKDLQANVTSEAVSVVQKNSIKDIEREMSSLAKDIISFESQEQSLLLQYQDSSLFIATLTERMARLSESEAAHSEFGEISFVYCPSCLQPLESAADNCCHVCKKSTEGSKLGSSSLVRMKQEMAQQIKESQILLKKDLSELEDVQQELKVKKQERSRIAKKYESLLATVRLDRDQNIDNVYQRIGFLEGKVEELNKLLKLGTTLGQLSDTKASLNSRISEIKDKINQGMQLQKVRGQKAAESICEKTADLLHKDLKREKVFENAEVIEFDFAKSILSVDGRNQFSASSMILLKNAFHFSLLWSSLEHSFFKYPRFILMDNMEDKGMEPERSQNFQNLIAGISASSEVKHQIIISTSMVSPALEKSGLTIGEFYTEENKTLKI